MPVFSDILDLSEMKVGEVEDAYLAGNMNSTHYYGYRLAHEILVNGKAEERGTEHVPTRVVARELVSRKGKNPDKFPDLSLEF